MPLKPHPTDPDKLVLVSKTYKLPKPWVGLTDEEWEPLYDKFAKHQEYGAFVSGWGSFARAIEAALKEKNT